MVEHDQIEPVVGPFSDGVDAAAFVVEWWENAVGRRLPGEECVSTLSRKSIGWLIDTGVVSEVVTSSARGQFVLEKCPIRRESNPPLGDAICSTCVYITAFFLRNQTYSVRFSKRAFYGSINKTNIRSSTCFT